MVLALIMCMALFTACDGGEQKKSDKENLITVKEFTGVASTKPEDGQIIVTVCDEHKDALGETVKVVLPEGKEPFVLVGDEVRITVARIEHTSPLTVFASKFSVVYEAYPEKPILYFYPESELECSVKVTLPEGKLTCTYPEHGADGWQNFIARPDGTLVFPDGKEYYCLYWEAESKITLDFTKGFCVKGSDTAAFLETVLAEMGLNAREANEFIIYWLPILQENPYNLISFQGDEYTSAAQLEITPTPDSILRVYMAAKPMDSYVEIEPQTFDGFERKGFTIVEWGGSVIE